MTLVRLLSSTANDDFSRRGNGGSGILNGGYRADHLSPPGHKRSSANPKRGCMRVAHYGSSFAKERKGPVEKCQPHTKIQPDIHPERQRLFIFQNGNCIRGSTSCMRRIHSAREDADQAKPEAYQARHGQRAGNVMPFQRPRGADVAKDCANGNDVYDCRQSPAYPGSCFHQDGAFNVSTR